MVEESVDVAFAGRTLYDNDRRERMSDVFSLSPHIIVGSEKNGRTGDRTRDFLMLEGRVAGTVPSRQYGGTINSNTTPWF